MTEEMELERLKTNIVLPDGPPSSRMFFIGEAPGEEEDYTTKPFMGPAGGLFDRALRTVGIARGNIYIGNIFLQRPPNNDVGYYYRDSKNTILTWEGEEHLQILKQRLERMLKHRELTGEGPNILVALGATAMKHLTGRRRITKWRGTVLECTLVPGFKVYPTYHPSYINRLMNEPEERRDKKKRGEQNALPVFLKDLERAAEQSLFPEIRRPQRDIKVISTLSEVLPRLEALLYEPLVATDIETLPHKSGPILWCIGFAPSPAYAFVIPWIRGLRPVWSEVEEVKILQAISKLYRSPKVQKIFHNGSYDLSILGRYYGIRCADGTIEDTMYLHQRIYPYLPKALHFVTSILTWEPYYKDEGKQLTGKRISDEAEYVYNGKDCCVTREIFPILERDAKELEMWSGYRGRTMRNFPSKLYMEIRGVYYDQARQANLSVEFTKEAKLAANKVNALAGWTVNLNAPAQVAKLLYGQFGCPVQLHHKTKRPSTDKDSINRLKKYYRDKRNPTIVGILENISEYRKLSKLVSTYTEMEIEEDGRVRTSYTPVSTQRLSSSKSHFGGGGNLQNITVRSEEGLEIRGLFIPDPPPEGEWTPIEKIKLFTISDLRQAEAMEVAWMAGDQALIERYLAGEDVHWFRAGNIFGFRDIKYEKEEEIADQYTKEAHTMYFYRRLGKTVVHASNYKMGPRMLQNILLREEIFLDETTCKKLLLADRAANPLIVQWQNNVIEQVRATRTIITPLGTKRIFRGRLDDNLYRAAIAFGPQSTVGELLQIAIQDIYDTTALYEPLLNVHDEVVGQNDLGDEAIVIADLKKCMEITHEVNKRDLTIPCDIKIGLSWKDAKELKESEVKEWLTNGEKKTKELARWVASIRRGDREPKGLLAMERNLLTSGSNA